MAVYAREPKKTLLERAIVLVILAVLLCLLMSAVTVVWSHFLNTQCETHLRMLWGATHLYATQQGNPDGWLPASEPGGPWWFQKVEEFVEGYETGAARETFRCPKAPPGQRGFTRQSIAYGWNELECGGKKKLSMFATRLKETALVGDSWQGQQGGGITDTLVTDSKRLRLDARHGARGEVVFLDGHAEALSRAEARQRWPGWTLAPPRPPEETYRPLALPWTVWLVIGGGLLAVYLMALGGLYAVRRFAAARAARQRQEAKARERGAEATAEQDYETARREFLKKVPGGPLEPLSLPQAVIHLGKRNFRLRPDREVIIGRSERAHIRIHGDRQVEPEHAKIRPHPDGYVLYDLYSRSGTHVGGRPVERKLLAPGDRIRIGDAHLTFQLRDA